ncbi:MAG: XrtA system polysaccharide deacetylase [Sedimenticola sp.]
MSIQNAMTIDVEDYFQVSAFEKHIDRSSWGAIPTRVEANMERIFAMLDEHGIKATFFMLGCLAQQYPQIARNITGNGHELASHGWEHIRVTNQGKMDFLQDVSRTKALLEDIGGEPVQGYRAASYSISKNNLWALDVLAEAGYKYSSSIVPIRHDLYGIPDAPRFAFPAAQGKLLEVPVTTLALGSRNIPCGGGGWFRLFPYQFSRWALNSVNEKDGQPCIFYFHPWEIDPDQPKQQGIGFKTRFRHYLNLTRMESRLRRLFSDFSWGRMDRIFLTIPNGDE